MKKFLLGILALSMLCTGCKKDKDEASLDKSQIVGKWKITKVTPAITITGLPPGTGPDVNEINDFDAVKKDQIYDFKADGSLSIDMGGGDIDNSLSYTIEGRYVVLVYSANETVKLAASLNGSTLTLVLEAEELKRQIKKGLETEGLDATLLNLILNAIGGKVEILATKL